MPRVHTKKLVIQIAMNGDTIITTVVTLGLEMLVGHPRKGRSCYVCGLQATFKKLIILSKKRN